MSRRESRAFDAHAIEVLGVPGAVLMENAGRGAAEVIFSLPECMPLKRAVIFCGAGNNGGDGFVIARHLVNRGCTVQVLLCGDPARLRGDALINYRIGSQISIPTARLEVRQTGLLEAVRSRCKGGNILVDALFGTGLKDELTEPYAALISIMNAQHIPIVAVDIPSGLDCDTGLPMPVSIEAVATVTFGGLKLGFVRTPESRRATGRVFVASIGVEPVRQT